MNDKATVSSNRKRLMRSVAGQRKDASAAFRRWWQGPWRKPLLLAAAMILATAGAAQAVELCSQEAHQRMLTVGIREEQIAALCPGRSRGLLTLSVRRTEDELGYCRITLALRNDSIYYLNALSLTTAAGRFDVFHFYNILPGGTGYASASSRSLLACDELGEVKVALLWPGSIRVDDRPLRGRRLQQFKPVLESPVLEWSP